MKGQFGAPFSLVVAVLVFAAMLLIIHQQLSKTEEEACHAKVLAEINKLKAKIEKVYSSPEGIMERVNFMLQRCPGPSATYDVILFKRKKCVDCPAHLHECWRIGERVSYSGVITLYQSVCLDVPSTLQFEVMPPEGYEDCMPVVAEDLEEEEEHISRGTMVFVWKEREVIRICPVKGS